MKILVIGSGGREHALCWALKQNSGDLHEVICAPGNAGIAKLARCVAIDPTDRLTLREFAEREKIDLTVVGPEAPLAAGLVDEFEERGLAIAGPSREAARLESSKAFAKAFMARHRIPTARFRVTDSATEALDVLGRGEFGEGPVVIKADGLAAGKGVVVASSRTEAEQTIRELVQDGRAGSGAWSRILLEEALQGGEVSLLLWSDGEDYSLMPPARDHKRIGEKDTGPNTGGMGAVTAPGLLGENVLAKIVAEIVEPTLAGARAEGFAFRGILFVGLMLTPDGPQVLEYNVRFGDPEAQAILVRLKSDLAEVFLGITRKATRLRQMRLQWSDDASACVVLAAPGYPEHAELGGVITGLKEAAGYRNVQLFHAGTVRAEDGSWQTAGGRVLGVTATGESLDRALSHCYHAINLIHWDGMQWRRDIGRDISRERR